MKIKSEIQKKLAMIKEHNIVSWRIIEYFEHGICPACGIESSPHSFFTGDGYLCTKCGYDIQRPKVSQ